jgi:two-component system CheB/CheR fusion protein
MASKNKKSSGGKSRSQKTSPSARVSGAGEATTGPESAGHAADRTGAYRIVAIGGSSGSLDALERLLHVLKPNTRMGFVFIQHLDPTHESILPEILSRSSKLAITQARDGDQVAPEHLYVIPPNADLSIKDGVLRLTPRSDVKATHLPIDSFFRDLSEDIGPRAVGVVLSGSGFDGSLGLLAIKAAGGLTFAQEPSSAKFDSMPRSAIATGEVDFVLTPERIGEELNPLLERELRVAGPVPGEAAIAQSALSEVLQALARVTGTDLGFYKPANLSRRIQRRMLLNHASSMEAYAQLLRENPTEVNALYNDILISVTSFFRDGASVNVFSESVFSELLKRRNNHPIRIWAPGCSSGEEAYSLAIGLAEFAEQKGVRLSAQIFATDLRDAAIERARLGIYPPAIASDVSPSRLRRFFHEVEGGYQVTGSIREQCIFARHNLLADPPFSQLDLVSCRNVLIYFKPEYQTRAMSTFYYSLKANGLLVLGRSESPGGSDLFLPVDSRHRVYRKNANAAYGTAVPFGSERLTMPSSQHPRPHHVRAEPADDLQKEADRLVLQSFAPPGVLVNEQFDVIQFRGRTGLFLESPSGHATLNVIRMAREEFRLELQALLYDVRKRKTIVRKDGLSVRRNGDQVWFTVEACPLDAFGEGKFFLVLFRESFAQEAVESAGDSADRSELDRLRDELTSAKAQLQAIIEELEATNEEIKAANEEVLSSNEELQSMNEELETAKEELQSANEELTTVNEELQNRNAELAHVAADLGNLLASVNIPILMLSRDLRIRRYTPSATKVFNLIQTDIGRPITDINLNLSIPDLEGILLRSIDGMSPDEREVSDKSGRRYMLRVQPFKTMENRIEGVVMMLLDRKDFAGGIQRPAPADYAEALVGTLDWLVAVLDAEGKIQSASEAFRKELALDGNPVGRHFRDALPGAIEGGETERLVRDAIEREDHSGPIEVSITAREGETGRYRAKARRIRLKTPGDPILVLLELERVGQ